MAASQPPPGRRDAVEVREAVGRRDRRFFLRLPWRLYAGDANWVPPLLGSLDRQLDPRRHPFFEHAEARLYLAWRNGRPVGRIVAIVNHLHNETHGDRMGFFGYFESERDPAVARALLDRAAADLREHGMTAMSGPFNPSINGECGLLVEGFDSPPVCLMPYNPPWYPELLEEAGLRPVKELYAYHLTGAAMAPDRKLRQRLQRIAEGVVRRQPGLTVRSLDMRRYGTEVVALGKLFNAARRGNWGFVPATDAELRLMAREMKPVVRPELILTAELRGEPVGCLIALPDVNVALRKVNGRLLPFGWLRLLLHGRQVRSIRVFGAACLPEHRNLGITPLLFERFIERGLRMGCEEAELSWVAEDNRIAVSTNEAAFEARRYKRYRIYGREL